METEKRENNGKVNLHLLFFINSKQTTRTFY